MKVGWYDEHKRELVRAGKRVFQAKTVLLSWSEVEGGDEFVEEIVRLEPPVGPRD